MPAGKKAKPRRPVHARRSPRSQRARTRPPTPFPIAYNVRVGDVLSAPVILVGTNASLFDALVLMRTHNISGMPVIDAERTVVGVVSEKDLARVTLGESGYPEIKGFLDVLMLGMTDLPSESFRRVRKSLETTRVSEAMSSPPFVIRPEAPLEFAAEVMRDQGINRLPVVDEHCLVGIVTRHDLARALVASRSPRR